MKDPEREAETQREKQAPCKEPNMGLVPGTPGSHPGLNAGTKPLSHPGIPWLGLFFFFFFFVRAFDQKCLNRKKNGWIRSFS